MNRLLASLAITAAGIPMLAGVAQLPRAGAPDAPVHTHVAARYLAGSPGETGAENVVTGVLLNYRAFDTFGEVTIIFAALAAVLAVLSPVAAAAGAPKNRPTGTEEARHRRVPPVSPIVAFVLRLAAPFIMVFAVWMMLKGHLSPGGGFQGGAMIGALLILLSIVLERDHHWPGVPERLVRGLQAAAPLAFGAVALGSVGLTGAVLALPANSAGDGLRELMMLVMEAGIGIGGAAIILGLFLAIRGA
jgi:multicomponent Na+:H+ antiporter subunit B